MYGFMKIVINRRKMGLILDKYVNSWFHMLCSVFDFGEVPERSKGTDCKSVGAAFVGSNPTLTTTRRRALRYGVVSRRKLCVGGQLFK